MQRRQLHSMLFLRAAPFTQMFSHNPLRSVRLRTFPDYLFVQLKKFTVGEDWTPKKLDVAVDVSDELDLSFLRSKGLQPGEECLPDTELPNVDSATPQIITFDTAVLSQLCDMGFTVDSCKRALYNTSNTGIDSAMNWIMEHMNDPDFNDPFTLDGASSSSFNPAASKSEFVADSEALAMIMSMGFSQEQALRALRETVLSRLLYNFSIKFLFNTL